MIKIIIKGVNENYSFTYSYNIPIIVIIIIIYVFDISWTKTKPRPPAFCVSSFWRSSKYYTTYIIMSLLHNNTHTRTSAYIILYIWHKRSVVLCSFVCVLARVYSMNIIIILYTSPRDVFLNYANDVTDEGKRRVVFYVQQWGWNRIRVPA